MTQRQTNRSRVLRRIGAAVAATIAVSTVTSTATNAASTSKVGAYGGVGDVKVAIGDTFGGFCVGQNLNNSALGGARTIYETIVEKSIGGDYIPMLAQSWTKNADMTEWTFKLRQGVKFHDGADWNADAMITNFNALSGRTAATAFWTGTAAAGAKLADSSKPDAFTTLADYTVKSLGDYKIAKGTALPSGIAALAPTIAAEYVKAGLTQQAALVKAGKDIAALTGTIKMTQTAGWLLGTAIAFSGNMKTLTKVDDYTVKITLDRPQNDFPGTLYASGRFTMRSPAQLASPTNCQNKPIGTGPFMVESGYDRSVVGPLKLKVVRNANYWRKDKAGKQLPYLNSITFTNVKEASTRSVAVRKGTYDLAQFTNTTEGKFMLDLRRNNKQFVTELSSGAEYYPSLWLNQAKPGSPFKSKNARLAVLHCLDRVNFVKTRTSGAAAVADGLVGSKNPMYVKSIHKFDVALSKKYAAAYKKETGKQLEFGFPSDISKSSIGNSEFFKKQWAKCGIKANYSKEESYTIIAKAWNSGATSLGDQNAYDAFFATLFEGTDTTFNLPFIKSNSFDYKLSQTLNDEGKPDPTTEKAAGGASGPASIFRYSLGSLLQLNKHSDTTIDDMLYAGQAATTKAAAKKEYAKATRRLVSEGYMGAVTTLSFSFFINKNSKISNIGVIKLPEGKTQRKMTNFGIDWVGVKKG